MHELTDEEETIREIIFFKETINESEIVRCPIDFHNSERITQNWTQHLLDWPGICCAGYANPSICHLVRAIEEQRLVAQLLGEVQDGGSENFVSGKPARGHNVRINPTTEPAGHRDRGDEVLDAGIPDRLARPNSLTLGPDVALLEGLEHLGIPFALWVA